MGIVNRRELLATAAIGITASIAGCTDGSNDSPEPDPEPAPSELRVSVTNNDTTPHTVQFVLRTTRAQSTTVVGFELADIEPGATETRAPETLDPGEYTLEVDLTTQEMGTETTWAGHNCPVKALDIELREDGFRIQNQCVDE